MCTKLSPCCDTVTPLAVSDAISLSSFWILFVSAIASASASGEECGRGDAEWSRARARGRGVSSTLVVGRSFSEAREGLGRENSRVVMRSMGATTRARDGVVLVDDECDDEANEGETCERWRDARWRCSRAR